MSNVAMKINEELNGIELYFASKPSEEIRSNLKANKFRYSGNKNCWYAKQNENTFQIANDLTSNIVEFPKITATTENKVKNVKAKKESVNLWEATQGVDMKVNGEQDTKEIAKEIRTHIRKRFPQCKISVTVPYYGKIDIEIKSSPFEKGSVYLKAIMKYCDQLAEAYRICYSAGDSYQDIAASYNFHFFRTSTHWEYKQTEVTEEIKMDMEQFGIKLAEQEQYEEVRKEQEYQEFVKQQEIRKQQEEVENAKYAKQREEEKKQVENIHNSVDVKELDENNQYFVIGSEFADLNKNNTIDQYQEEVAKGKYSLEDVKVTKEVHFNSLKALENFSNLLLHDFDFLVNTGGSFTDDNRINSTTDYHNMDKEERQTVKWFLQGVAIYFNNELQFVVDAQGYNYACYVGLTCNAKNEKSIIVDQILDGAELEELKVKADELGDISTSVIDELNIYKTWQTDNWNEYKEVMKYKLNDYGFKLIKGVIQQLEIEELKTSMYRLLIEVDGIQEQFKNADIQQGEKLTLFYIGGLGSIITSQITFDSVTNTKYAQYDNAVKLTFTPEGKRKLHYQHFYSTLLVFKGWQSLPEDVLNHVEKGEGFTRTRSKYFSCDNKQYDEILNYFESQGKDAVVNTYKPRF